MEGLREGKRGRRGILRMEYVGWLGYEVKKEMFGKDWWYLGNGVVGGKYGKIEKGID